MQERASSRYLIIGLVLGAALAAGFYFYTAAQRECGGAWNYKVDCPPLTCCVGAGRKSDLARGHCLPCLRQGLPWLGAENR